MSLHKQVIAKLRGLREQIFVLSPGFCGSGIWGLLSSMGLAQGLSEGAVTCQRGPLLTAPSRSIPQKALTRTIIGERTQYLVTQTPPQGTRLRGAAQDTRAGFPPEQVMTE